jgi:hypothetical protein
MVDIGARGRGLIDLGEQALAVTEDALGIWSVKW